MLFETTIYRADEELAVGADPWIDASVALDGIDEFLDNLPYAEYFAPRVRDLRGSGERVSLWARDADTSWTVLLGPEGFTWDHSMAGDGEVRVEGEAAHLLLFAYGRVDQTSPHLHVAGETGVLSRWVEDSRI